jgi:hypothetical protein
MATIVEEAGDVRRCVFGQANRRRPYSDFAISFGAVQRLHGRSIGRSSEPVQPKEDLSTA